MEYPVIEFIDIYMIILIEILFLKILKYLVDIFQKVTYSKDF